MTCLYVVPIICATKQFVNYYMHDVDYTSARAGAEASVKSLLPIMRVIKVQLVYRDFKIG